MYFFLNIFNQFLFLYLTFYFNFKVLVIFLNYVILVHKKYMKLNFIKIRNVALATS